MKKLLLLLLILAAAALVLRLRYGGGEPYPDLTTPPALPESGLEEVLAYPEPIGNVAVSAEGRVFFTVHPESRPAGNRLLEYVAGAAEPFPDGASQERLFDTVLGTVVDGQNRLWTIDHGNHGLRDARLLAFDLATGDVVHDHVFGASLAPAGSFLQDLQVSVDGATVVIADASIWRKRPALIVYDVARRSARRVLENHASVSAEEFVIRTATRKMTYAGSLLALRGGVDGLALGSRWLCFGALSGSGLYRIALDDLRDAALPAAELAARVERIANKPLSDGFSVDLEGNVFVTDVEHNAIFRVGTDRELETVLRSPRIRWPDALSFGPDGWLYVADSALQDVILKPREQIRYSGPYRIFRFRPGTAGRPGH
jgi:hypothetical protein